MRQCAPQEHVVLAPRLHSGIVASNELRQMRKIRWSFPTLVQSLRRLLGANRRGGKILQLDFFSALVSRHGQTDNHTMTWLHPLDPDHNQHMTVDPLLDRLDS